VIRRFVRWAWQFAVIAAIVWGAAWVAGVVG